MPLRVSRQVDDAQPAPERQQFAVHERPVHRPHAPAQHDAAGRLRPAAHAGNPGVAVAPLDVGALLFVGVHGCAGPLAQGDSLNRIRPQPELSQQPPYPLHLPKEPGVQKHGALSVVLDEQMGAAQRVADGMDAGRDFRVHFGSEAIYGAPVRSTGGAPSIKRRKRLIGRPIPNLPPRPFAANLPLAKGNLPAVGAGGNYFFCGHGAGFAA